MAVTIKQIAEKAGVSRGTVDRVLHNRPGVKPEVAEYVRRIADELGFLPNRAGKILAARKQPLKIGCFLPGKSNPFFEDVVAGYRAAEEEYTHFGVSLEVLEVEGYDPAEHLASIRRLREEGCGALCLTTMDVPEIRACVDEMVEAGIPAVTINNDLTGTRRLCYVGADYYKSGCVAAALIRMMTREPLNMVIATGSHHVKGHNDRVRGFSQTMRKQGPSYRLVDVFESLDNEEYAYRMTREILQLNREINCVYIASAASPGIARAVIELGREKDILIASCDDTAEIRRLVEEGVIDFTVCQEPWQQGYRAVQLLFDYFMDNRRAVPVGYITDTVIKIRENI